MEKLGGDGIVIDYYGCSLREPNCSNGAKFKDGDIFEASWNEYSLSNIDYNNHTADGEQELIVKYAYPDNPDDWYWTRLPVKVHYTTAPKILDYEVHSTAGSSLTEPRLDFSLQGAFWIESITLEAELWETVWGYNEGHYYEYTQKKDEQTFVIKPEDLHGEKIRDGSNHFVPWSSVKSDYGLDFSIVVKSISINRRK